MEWIRHKRVVEVLIGGRPIGRPGDIMHEVRVVESTSSSLRVELADFYNIGQWLYLTFELPVRVSFEDFSEAGSRFNRQRIVFSGWSTFWLHKQKEDLGQPVTYPPGDVELVSAW